MTASINKPSRSLAGFPGVEIEDTLPLYRSTATTNAPWWFGSNGTQRFDLSKPRGTCYLATSIETAIRERGRERLLNSGMVSPAFVAEMNVYELRLSTIVNAADTTSSVAVTFGANRELTTIVPYEVSCAWAEGLADEGFGGLAYASRYTSGSQWNALALFGDAGDAGWGHVKKMTGRMAIVDAGLKDLIQDHPPLKNVAIIATPPPLKKK